MRKILPIIFCLVTCQAFADAITLENALRATYTACIGINDELSGLKTMAGINTAVTSVGTAAGAGATVVGIVKSSKDAKAEQLEQILQEIREKSENLAPMTELEVTVFMDEFNNSYNRVLRSADEIESELEKTNRQSKSLGNWRTGLLATSGATNVAGAIIAGTNQVRGDLKQQLETCVAAVDTLRDSIIQARLDGYDVTEAQEIADTCGEFKYADISSINTRGTGAAISSGVGAATGIAGAIVSASANKPRNDNNAQGKDRERNLNTASNILAGATTAASATATVFNATQIGAIRRVSEIAEKCTGVLK